MPFSKLLNCEMSAFLKLFHKIVCRGFLEITNESQHEPFHKIAVSGNNFVFFPTPTIFPWFLNASCQIYNL